MRHTLIILAVLSLVGCAGSPPKPPLPIGDYRPINLPTTPVEHLFDFSYEGDVLGVLQALKDVAPQITILPHLGQASPLPVRLHLTGVHLEEALRAIGEQGGGIADVVWHTTPRKTIDQVFIRFFTHLESNSTNQKDSQ